MGALKIRGLVYLFLRIKIIKLIREIFVLDLKQGREMMIPIELRMDHLPESFKFYDPLLSILQQDIDFFSKYAFNIRKQINENALIDESLWKKFMDKLQIKEDRPIHQLTKAHVKNFPKEISYKYNLETRDLQRSKCIVIEYRKEMLAKKGIQNLSKSELIQNKLKFQYIK